MPTPFPGMDPYLERPAGWLGFHNGFIATMRASLNRVLPPNYYAALEERSYLESPEELVLVGRPDLTVRATSGPPGRPTRTRSAPTTAIEVKVPLMDRVRETYIEIRAAPDGDVITVVDLLSYSNKRAGKERLRYVRKRLDILASLTHLVEIDLLRTGKPMKVYGADRTSDYTLLVSREDRRPKAQLYPFGVRDPIPKFILPLRRGDPEPEVDVAAVLHQLYDDARYHLSVDYKAEPEPPLGKPDRAWAHQLLKGAGLR